MELHWSRKLRQQHGERYVAIPKEVAECWDGIEYVRITMKRDNLIITPIPPSMGVTGTQTTRVCR